MSRVPLSSVPTVAALYKSGKLASSTAPSHLSGRVSLWQGDICRLETDAIVNAAKNSLLGGGGVDGAIHRAAGPELLEACRPLKGCETGDAKVTPGYALPAKFVVHTVGPVYSSKGEDAVKQCAEKLASAYRRSLEEAVKTGEVKSIAFPSISTGVYGYPIRDATKIALRTVADFLSANTSSIDRVIFCTFSPEDMAVYEDLVGEVFGPETS